MVKVVILKTTKYNGIVYTLALSKLDSKYIPFHFPYMLQTKNRRAFNLCSHFHLEE